jgi:hypothetical protein
MQARNRFGGAAVTSGVRKILRSRGLCGAKNGSFDEVRMHGLTTLPKAWREAAAACAMHGVARAPCCARGMESA